MAKDKEGHGSEKRHEMGKYAEGYHYHDKEELKKTHHREFKEAEAKEKTAFGKYWAGSAYESGRRDVAAGRSKVIKLK